eukprot:1990039-Rhodomonas_salina.1
MDGPRLHPPSSSSSSSSKKKKEKKEKRNKKVSPPASQVRTHATVVVVNQSHRNLKQTHDAIISNKPMMLSTSPRTYARTSDFNQHSDTQALRNQPHPFQTAASDRRVTLRQTEIPESETGIPESETEIPESETGVPNTETQEPMESHRQYWRAAPGLPQSPGHP